MPGLSTIDLISNASHGRVTAAAVKTSRKTARFQDKWTPLAIRFPDMCDTIDMRFFSLGRSSLFVDTNLHDGVGNDQGGSG